MPRTDSLVAADDRRVAVSKIRADITVVVIGRNEGERLHRCLESVRNQIDCVVYVDSASIDGSVELAGSMGAHVVELDASAPLTAARARNAGFAFVVESVADAEYVQFVDGDCEVAPGWLEQAAEFLDEHSEYGLVCGRLRERHPEASIYNRLCDLEWDRPAGDIDCCGGIFMVRVAAFVEAGGFDVALRAGEEPELCHRLRQHGWQLHRLDCDMALHDAAMTRFSQWWHRSVRCGEGYATICRSGSRTGRLYRRQRASALLWAVCLPGVGLAALAASFWLPWLWLISLLALTALGAQGWRIFRQRRQCGTPPAPSALYATFCLLAKWPQAWGILRKSVAVERHSGRNSLPA